LLRFSLLLILDSTRSSHNRTGVASSSFPRFTLESVKVAIRPTRERLLDIYLRNGMLGPFTQRTFFVIVTHRKAILVAAVSMTLLTGATAKGQWVAYNDQIAGATTSPNATTNDIRQQTTGPLKNVANGTNLPVILSITRSEIGLFYTSFGNAPPVGSPLYDAFNGYVFF